MFKIVIYLTLFGASFCANLPREDVETTTEFIIWDFPIRTLPPETDDDNETTTTNPPQNDPAISHALLHLEQKNAQMKINITRMDGEIHLINKSINLLNTKLDSMLDHSQKIFNPILPFGNRRFVLPNQTSNIINNTGSQDVFKAILNLERNNAHLHINITFMQLDIDLMKEDVKILEHKFNLVLNKIVPGFNQGEQIFNPIAPIANNNLPSSSSNATNGTGSMNVFKIVLNMERNSAIMQSNITFMQLDIDVIKQYIQLLEDKVNSLPTIPVSSQSQPVFYQAAPLAINNQFLFLNKNPPTFKHISPSGNGNLPTSNSIKTKQNFLF